MGVQVNRLKRVLEIIYIKIIYLSVNWMSCFQTLNCMLTAIK